MVEGEGSIFINYEGTYGKIRDVGRVFLLQLLRGRRIEGKKWVGSV